MKEYDSEETIFDKEGDALAKAGFVENPGQINITNQDQTTDWSVYGEQVKDKSGNSLAGMPVPLDVLMEE